MPALAQAPIVSRRRPTLPISTTGLFLYVTAEDACAGLANGAAIASFRDQSPYKHTGATAGAGNRPTAQLTAGPNGGPAIRFDGIDDYVTFNNPSFPQPCHYFIVAKAATGQSGNRSLIASGSGSQHSMFIQGSSSPVNKLGIFDGAATISSTASYAGEWYLFEHNPKADPDLAYVNGTQVISGNSGSDASGVIRIGANSVLTGSYNSMDVCAIAAYNRSLSTTERQALENYLIEHYGVLGVAPMARRYYFGAFDDSPLTVGNPSAFFAGINAIGLDSAMFTNGSSGRVETLAAAADIRGIPIFIGDLEELAANPASDITALAHTHWRHKSLQNNYVKDEPNEATEPGISANITTWVNAYRTADPRREAFALLIGVDARKDIYKNSGMRVLVLDAYPYATGAPALDTTMGGFGYAFNMAEYLRQMTTARDPNDPLYVVLQTHGGGVGLRVPTAAELNLEYWIATAAGANGVFWFIWSTEDFWTGLDNVADPNGLRAGLLALSGELTYDVRAFLKDTVPVGQEWSATNGALVRTMAIPDVTGKGIGPDRVVIIYNPTTSTINAGLAPLAGGPRSLTNLRTGASLPGIVTNTYALPAGHGLALRTTGQNSVGVPDVPIDWTQTPTQRRDAHPFNDPAWTIELHPLAATITTSMTATEIQAVYDQLPPGPCRVEWQGPHTYTIPTSTPLRIYGRSNLHNVAVGGTVTITPGGTPPPASTTATDYQLPNILIGPGIETLEPTSTAYGSYNAGVDTGSNSPIPWLDYFHRPVTDIYWQGFNFDGAGRLVRPLTGTSWRRVLFRNCSWSNLRDSFEASAGADGFHWASITINTRVEQVSILDCVFNGPGRWAIYFDGPHGGCIARNTIAGSSYGSGGFVMLTNDDFSYREAGAGVAETNDEKRSAMYQLFWANAFSGSCFQILSYSGGNLLFDNNTINQCNLMVGVTPRGSNKWAPLTGLVYYHFGNEITDNTVGSITGDGSQGLVYTGLSHCGVGNTPSTFWASPQGRPYWGRMGTGIDPLVPGVTKSLKVTNNVVTSGPVGLILIDPDNVPGEPGPAGTLEGVIVASGNTNNGSALSYP